MPAINPKELPTLSGELYVADSATPSNFTRIGSVRNITANVDLTVNTLEVNADDTGTVFKGNIPELRIEGEFLENMSRDKLELLIGGTTSDVAGSLVSGATQTVTSGNWAYNQFIEIENQNGDGSAITVNSVTLSTDGAIVEGTDFYVGQNESGDYGIFIIDSATVTTTSQDVTIDYDYTPNASEDIDIKSEFQEAPVLVVKVEAPENGKMRRVTIDKARFNASYNMDFLDPVNAGDLTGTEFTFTGDRGATFNYYDENL